MSDPIVTDTGAVVVKVARAEGHDGRRARAGKQQTQDELLNERRNRFFAAYMTKAREQMKININREAIAQLICVGVAGSISRATGTAVSLNTRR